MKWILVGALLLGPGLRAQRIAGTWQGLITDNGSTYRQIFRFSKTDSGWRTVYYSLDEAADSVHASQVTLEGRTLKVSFPPYFGSRDGASYEAVLAPDGRSLTGTFFEPPVRYPLTVRLVRAKQEWAVAPPPHAIRFIQVKPGVKLEVLDWGGTGRPLVFLTGLGDAAHVFDAFAQKFTPTYHVYAITRRGFGASSAPTPTSTNYTADRLGDDVLAIIDSLGLHRPVLIGHSIGGEELSSVGSRHPDKVAGLIYLDAGYGYALYNRSRGDFILDRGDLLQQLQRLQPDRLTRMDLLALVHAIRDTTLPRFEKDLQELQALLDRTPPAAANGPPPDTTFDATHAILNGVQKYTSMPVPILAIYAVPHKPPTTHGADSAAEAQMIARQDSNSAAFATAFEHSVPSAHVVRIPNSTHYVFTSNEADVLREMRAFLATLAP